MSTYTPDIRTQRPETNHACTGCGSAVSARFARVFGDNNDQVHACHGCATPAQLTDGAAWDPDYDTDADRSEMRGLQHPVTASGFGCGNVREGL